MRGARAWRHESVAGSQLAARKLEEGRRKEQMHFVLPTVCEVCLETALVPGRIYAGRGRAGRYRREGKAAQRWGVEGMHYR
jgi:hypothetical protein